MRVKDLSGECGFSTVCAILWGHFSSTVGAAQWIIVLGADWVPSESTCRCHPLSAQMQFVHRIDRCISRDNDMTSGPTMGPCDRAVLCGEFTYRLDFISLFMFA